MTKGALTLPNGKLAYPDELNERRDSLIVRGKEALEKKDVREKLIVIADIFNLLGDQMEYETAIQTRALMVTMRDRKERGAI